MAGMDADAQAERFVQVMAHAVVQLLQRLRHVAGGAQRRGAAGIAAGLRLGQAEQRHHPVADELVDPAAGTLHRRAHQPEILVGDEDDVIGQLLLGKPGEGAQVGEQDADLDLLSGGEAVAAAGLRRLRPGGQQRHHLHPPLSYYVDAGLHVLSQGQREPGNVLALLGSEDLLHHILFHAMGFCLGEHAGMDKAPQAPQAPGTVVGSVVGSLVGSAVGGSVVGSAVGSEVGSLVGSKVGSVVGSLVGSAVGSAVGGSVVGSLVGSAVGSTVGSAVGSEVGSAVGGSVVGSAVGSLVGSLVGSAVGSEVGSAVGPAVGSTVGSAVGSNVGAALGAAAVAATGRAASSRA